MELVVNIDKNFFELNKEFEYFDEAQRLIETYGREKASRLLWAVYQVEDPEAKMSTFAIQDKLSMVRKNYLKEPDFNWEDIDYLRKGFPGWFMSPIKRNLKGLCDTWDALQIQAATYDMTNPKEAKIALDILKNAAAITKSLAEAKKLFDEEVQEKRGNRGEDQPGPFAKMIQKKG